MTYNGGVRDVSCRVDIIRGGVKAEELVPLEPPTVTMDSSAEIKMRMSGVFRKNPAVDYFHDILRPTLILDGVEHMVGEFIVGTAEETWENGVASVAIEAYDAALLLQQWTTEEFLYIAAGSRYDAAISSLLALANIGRVLFVPTNAVFKTDREDWEPGTPYLTIVNDLLSEIGYEDIWFDLDGVARLRPYVPPSAANITHTYSSGEGSVILPRYRRTMDIYSAPNVFNVILNNPEYPEPMSAHAENKSMASALSIPRRGRRIVAPTVEVENIASQEALQAHVDRLMYESMKSEEIVEFETAALPTHSFGGVISLDMPEADLSGIYAETEWELVLGPGEPMRHVVRRAVIVD